VIVFENDPLLTTANDDPSLTFVNELLKIPFFKNERFSFKRVVRLKTIVVFKNATIVFVLFKKRLFLKTTLC